MNVRQRGRRQVAIATAGLTAVVAVGAAAIGLLARNDTIAQRASLNTTTGTPGPASADTGSPSGDPQLGGTQAGSGSSGGPSLSGSNQAPAARSGGS